MRSTICKYILSVLFVLTLLLPESALAKCGGVDYSWGSDALAMGHDYIVTMMLYVQYIVFVIGAIVAVIGALQIYVKMNTGEGDITKSILVLCWGCLFLITASVVLPAFFGYDVV